MPIISQLFPDSTVFQWSHFQDSLSNCPFGKELLEHNLVIFRNGEGALQVLPQLLGVIPEAKLNLITYYLRQVQHVPYSVFNFSLHFACFQDELKEAFSLIQDIEPTLPIEYILKGIVFTLMGQETNNVTHWTTHSSILNEKNSFENRKNTSIRPLGTFT